VLPFDCGSSVVQGVCWMGDGGGQRRWLWAAGERIVGWRKEDVGAGAYGRWEGGKAVGRWERGKASRGVGREEVGAGCNGRRLNGEGKEKIGGKGNMNEKGKVF
jgi:hypothetical protein